MEEILQSYFKHLLIKNMYVLLPWIFEELKISFRLNLIVWMFFQNIEWIYYLYFKKRKSKVFSFDSDVSYQRWPGKECIFFLVDILEFIHTFAISWEIPYTGICVRNERFMWLIVNISTKKGLRLVAGRHMVIISEVV